MNPLQVRLAELRRRLWLVVGMRGISLVCAIILLTAAATGLIDWRLHLPNLVRAVLLTGSLAAAGVVTYRYLLLPLKARADDLSLALKVEARYPTLNDALASAVQFLEQQRTEEEPSVSPSLRKQAIQRALELAKGYDFRPVVDTRGVRTAGLSFVSAAALAVALSVIYPEAAWTAFLRLADPFGGHDWPRQTQLEIEARTRVARGAAFEVRGTITGVIPERATIEYRFDQDPPLVDAYELRRADDASSGTLVARLEGGRVRHDFRFQVRANDAVSPWYDVQVLPPPQLVPLAGKPSPQIRLIYPRYTDLAAAELPSGTMTLEAPAGTQILLRGATDRPIARAWLEYPQELTGPMKVAAFLATLGQCPAVAALEYTGAHLEAWRRIAAEIEPGGLEFSLECLARVSGTFTLHLEDPLGIEAIRLVEVRTITDPAPAVHLQRPSRAQDSLDVLADAEVTLHVLVEDPLYAVRSVSLEARRKKDEESLAEIRRLPLYDHVMMAEIAARLLSAAPGLPLRMPGLPPRLRPQHLDIQGRWSLAPLKLQEGDVVVIAVGADDFDDVTVGKQPGRSHEVELRVVNKLALDLALNEMQAQIQQDLVRLEKQQQEALDKVIPAEKQWRNNKGQLQPQHLDDLLQAEQLQQQIRARVGTKEEGLRAAVARALQTLRDNHLPRSGTQDRLEAVAAELDRLAREELDQIEPRLTEARKDNQASGEKFNQERKAPLPEARKHQEEVAKTFSELLRLLEPWSSTREVKGEAKSILQDQRQLAGLTAKLAEKTGAGEDIDKLDPSLKAELERAAELQNKLAERTRQLLEKMDRLAQSKQSQDPETARALKEASEKGKETNASGKMAEAEESVRTNNLAKAGNQQRESARAMEDVVRALEERREEELERLIKKMKEAEDKLTDLTERQERLQRKTKEAGQIADGAKREEELKRLAREQEQLQREAQEIVRELSRLRAERAGQALSQATGRMSQGGQRMGNAEDAAEQQDEALDRLNEAQQELQEAREEAQEELAREKIVKIADQIRGVREREESLLGESGRIHREVLERKGWTRPLKGSLISLSEAQKGLGEETGGIAGEKLEGTKVFAHLLSKSAEAMKQAAARMEARLNQPDPGEPAPNDGEPGLNLPAENAADSETQKLQRLALRRIDQLLDVLKTDGGFGRQAAKPSGGGGGGGAGGGGEQLPSSGQLKVLRDLQHELNERTQAFGKQHPDVNKLNVQEQAELQTIRQEQQEINNLFNELTAPAEAEGDKK
jgi:hypothetical protein